MAANFRLCNFFRPLIRLVYLIPATVSFRRSRTLLPPIFISTLCLAFPFSRKTVTLEEETAALMKVAYSQVRERDFDGADLTLHRILHRLADAAQANHLNPAEHAGRRARIFSELANIRLLQRNYQDAEKLLIETIRSCIVAGMDFHDGCIMELSLKLALLYSKLGDVDKASLGFQFCFDNQMTNISPIPDQNSDLSEKAINDIALLGLISNAYAHFLIQNGELKEAREKLQIALKSALKIYPPQHENCLHLRADLAHVESQIGSVSDALEDLQSAIDEAERQKSPTLPLIRLYCTGAIIDGNREEFVSAIKWLSRAHKACSNLESSRDRDTARNEIKNVQEMIETWSQAGVKINK